MAALEDLRFPCGVQWDEGGVTISVLGGGIEIEIERPISEQTVALSIRARDQVVGAAFLEHIARWTGLSVGEVNPDPGTLPQVTGRYLVTSSQPPRRELAGKAFLGRLNAEVYLSLRHDQVLSFSEKDAAYRHPLVQVFAHGLRDGTWTERFAPKQWPPGKPLVSLGPAEDLDPSVAVDAALRLAALGSSRPELAHLVQSADKMLRSLLEDPRTVHESLALLHRRFMVGKLGDETLTRGRAAVDRRVLLAALDRAAVLVKHGTERRPESRQHIRDLRLIWQK